MPFAEFSVFRAHNVTSGDQYLGLEAFEFGKAMPSQWKQHLVDEELPESPVFDAFFALGMLEFNWHGSTYVQVTVSYSFA